jgi:hypothetical protein
VAERREIRTDYLARVEGEGAMSVRLRDGEVESVELRIFEPPRFFEALLHGRSFLEAPDITARICGICPVAYQVSSMNAMEALCGVQVPEPIRALRRLLYGARTPDDLLFRPELEIWDADVTVDAAAAGWRGKVGVVPGLIPTAPFDPDNATAFVVGPEVMMRFAVRALVDRGLPEERIFVSLERNMRCGLGHCGHCQLGPTLICRDGPVYSHALAGPWLEVREL